MTASLRTRFEAMRPGDIVLMSEKNTKRFTHYAQVTFKLRSKLLGDALWPVRGERSWELIYFLRNIRRISIPKAEFVTKLGYKSDFDVAGATRVQDSRIRDFESKHGPVSEWFDIPYFQTEYVDVPRELRDGDSADYSATNVVALTKRRRQHEKFAALVKSNYGMVCAMCGVAEQDFLVAGHIVAWSEDEQNRLNPANGLCLCVLHDRAFERGYLVLDDALQIRMNPRLDSASALGRQLKVVDGRRIRLPMAHPPDQALLQRHRDRFLPPP